MIYYTAAKVLHFSITDNYKQTTIMPQEESLAALYFAIRCKLFDINLKPVFT